MSPGGFVVPGPRLRAPSLWAALRACTYPCGMSALAWWLIPVVATVLAITWAAWRARPERPTEAQDGMESLRRMQSAMERPMPTRDDT